MQAAAPFKKILHSKKLDALLRARVALGYFTLVACIGLLLRWQLTDPIEGINYKNFLHAHSHVALLGWLYCAFFAALLYAFPPDSEEKSRSFNLQFMFTQVAVLGMLFTFPVQGYALFSITFSTMHIMLNYWFAWSFWKHIKNNRLIWEKHQVALRFIGLSLIFLVLSTIGPWAMGPIMATGHTGSELYFSAIYYYLHFQYNGWFAFAVLGLFFWLLDKNEISYDRTTAHKIIWLFSVACIPTLALSVLWIKPAFVWYWVGGAGALLQVIAFLYFLKLIWEVRSAISLFCLPWVKGLLGLALLSLGIKIVLQLTSAIPAIADLAYQLRYFIIGYLHLSLIGFVSVFLLALFLQLRLYRLNKLGKLGLSLLLLFFVLSEVLMFLQGTLLWLKLPAFAMFNMLMFLLSVGMPIGLLVFFFTQPGLNKKNKFQSGTAKRTERKLIKQTTNKKL